MQELKRLMALHGGGFQLYPTRSNITHVICSNLPDAKVKQYERERWAGAWSLLLPLWLAFGFSEAGMQPGDCLVAAWCTCPARGSTALNAGLNPACCEIYAGAPSLWSGRSGLWIASGPGRSCR